MRRRYPRHMTFNLDRVYEQLDAEKEACSEAMAKLKQTDHNWEVWYDAHIPNDAKYPEITRLVLERVGELEMMAVTPEPQTVGEAVAVVYGCAEFGSREWFDGVKEIPF